MTSKNIQFYNIDTKKTIMGELNYDFIKELDDCKVKIELNGINIEYIDIDYFSALQIVRDEIYPWIPMINGCLIHAYPSGMSKSMSKGTSLYQLTLGKPSDIDETFYIFDETNDIKNLASVNTQEAYNQIWGYSFYTNSKNEGFKKDIILVEKVKKHSYIYNKKTYDIDKILNKNYQYFWAYDNESKKVYDIKRKFRGQYT